MPRSKQQSEQIRAESREQILTTARRLFSEQGFDACRVSDIARQAGMSQGNIYWYFPSKEDILQAVLSQGFEALGGMMSDIAAKPLTAAGKLDELLSRYITYGRQQGGSEFTNILITLMAQGGVERLKALGFDMLQIGTGYHRSLATILAQAQAEGVVLQGIDPQLLAMFVFSFFNGLMITYGEDWANVPDELVKEAAMRLLGAKNR